MRDREWLISGVPAAPCTRNRVTALWNREHVATQPPRAGALVPHRVPISSRTRLAGGRAGLGRLVCPPAFPRVRIPGLCRQAPGRLLRLAVRLQLRRALSGRGDAGFSPPASGAGGPVCRDYARRAPACSRNRVSAWLRDRVAQG